VKENTPAPKKIMRIKLKAIRADYQFYPEEK